MSTDRPSGLLQLTELDDIRRALDARQWFRAAARRGRSASEEDRRYFNLAVDLEHPQRQQVRAAITRTMEQNGTAPTRRRLVGVDGDYTTGKSQAVAHIMISHCEAVWREYGYETNDGNVRNVVQPAFFVNASSSGEADLMRSIADSLGLPQSARSTAVVLLNPTKRQCRRSHTTLGIIDDANMFESSRRGEMLTQFIKRLVNELPLTLVFVGKDLASSPVLHPTTSTRGDAHAAAQLARRLTLVRLDEVPLTGEGPRRWLSLIQSACRHFLLANPDPLGDLVATDYAWIHKVCEGRVGALYELLTIAASAAVGGTESLTSELLRETQQQISEQGAGGAG